MVILHSIGCAAPIFCKFENGIAYGFLSGVMVNLDLARKPPIQRYFIVECICEYDVYLSLACMSNNFARKDLRILVGLRISHADLS